MPEIVAENVDVYVFRVIQGNIEHLVLRRAADRLYAGSWRMVAGKIEAGEQAWQSAVRELWEETGFHPLEFFALPAMNSFYEWQTDRVKLIAAFGARAEGEPHLDAEHDAYAWLPLADALDRVEWPEHKRLLALLDAVLSEKGEVPQALRIPVA